jgi:hypothetical protein
MIVSTETKDIIIAHILKGHYSITVRLYDQNHDLYFVIISYLYILTWYELKFKLATW